MLLQPRLLQRTLITSNCSCSCRRTALATLIGRNRHLNSVVKYCSGISQSAGNDQIFEIWVVAVMFGKRGFSETETVLQTVTAHSFDGASKRPRCAWSEATSSAPELAAFSADLRYRVLLDSMLPGSGCGLQGRTNTLDEALTAVPPQAWCVPVSAEYF